MLYYNVPLLLQVNNVSVLLCSVLIKAILLKHANEALLA